MLQYVNRLRSLFIRYARIYLTAPSNKIFTFIRSLYVLACTYLYKNFQCFHDFDLNDCSVNVGQVARNPGWSGCIL